MNISGRFGGNTVESLTRREKELKPTSPLTSSFGPATNGAGKAEPLQVDPAESEDEIAGVTLEFSRPPAGDCIPESRKESVFGTPFITFLVLAAPALWAGILVFLYGVDTPWGDQWDGIWPLFEKMRAGTLGVADFFAFHNEHRIFFPRLITFGLAKLTHWNIRAELLVIWVLACVCALNLWRVALITGWNNARNRKWLFLAANVMLFTPLQWENLLWGFQIGFFLPLACLTACLWAGPSLRRPWCFVVTLVLCLVSTFSVASGFFSWLFTAPLLLLSQDKTRGRGWKISWLAWLFIGAVSTYFYFRGYTKPAAHPSTLEALKHPFRAIQFVLAYLGTPFSSGTALDPSAVASVAGAALVVPFCACLFYVWRWRRDHTLLAHSLPWISLAGWALVNALLTMLGRVGFGISAATQSRYVSFAIMLPLGLLFLAPLVFRHWRAQSGAGTDMGRGLTVLVTALAVLFTCGTIKSLEIWERIQHHRLSGKAALLLVNVLDEPDILARHVRQKDPLLKARINLLDRLDYLRPRLMRSNFIREIAYQTKGETRGEFNELGKSSGGKFAAKGWAILPENHRVADGVLLTYDDDQGEPIIFALAEVEYRRAEISKRLNDKAYMNCGWVKSWRAEQIPANSQWIRAWAFDAENCQAFAIGSAALQQPNAVP